MEKNALREMLMEEGIGTDTGKYEVRSLSQDIGAGQIAKKLDEGKPDLAILPKIAIEQMAYAFMYGEKKYGRFNYCAGFDSHRLVAAAIRHLVQWNDGENLDSESGHSHLGHALASIAMLLHTIELGTNRDTRYQKPKKE